MTTGFRKALVVALPFFAAVCAVAILNPVGDYWGLVEPPKAQVEAYDSVRLISLKALDSSVYDLRKLDRLIREPQNTVSNLAYILVGLAIIFSARRISSLSLGAAGVFLGIGSGLYHASLLPEWRMVDILGVYTVLLCLLTVGGVALGFIRAELRSSLCTWLIAFYAGIHRNDVRVGGLKVLDSKYVVVACFIFGSVLALYAVRFVTDRARYVRSAALLAVSCGLSFFGGVTDRFGGLWAFPSAIVQGHAVWHTFGALGLLAAYEIFAMTGFDRSVFSGSSGPNQALEPTSPAVTSRAGARAAPAGDVAHL